MRLTNSQQAAYDGIIKDKSKGILLFGAAGTGKSTLISKLREYYEKLGKTVILLAPTHQAKKVLTKILGVEALTIHKGLGLQPLDEQEFLKFRLGGKGTATPPDTIF